MNWRSTSRAVTKFEADEVCFEPVFKEREDIEIEWSRSNSLRFNVFGRQVLAVKSGDGWQLFYFSADGN